MNFLAWWSIYLSIFSLRSSLRGNSVFYVSAGMCWLIKGCAGAWLSFIRLVLGCGLLPAHPSIPRELNDSSGPSTKNWKESALQVFQAPRCALPQLPSAQSFAGHSQLAQCCTRSQWGSVTFRGRSRGQRCRESLQGDPRQRWLKRLFEPKFLQLRSCRTPQRGREQSVPSCPASLGWCSTERGS